MANDAGIETKNVAGAVTGMGIDQLISNLAIGIAQGQMNLDMECMKIATFMSTAQVAFGKRAGSEEPDLLSLIELGFTPNFYQFVDTILEIRVAVSSKLEEKIEVDTSDTQFQQNELEQQSRYEQQQQSAYSGSSYSGGNAWWWGGGAYWGSSSGYSGSSSSGSAASTSAKSKTLSLTTVDAKYASTYNFAVEVASTIKTKIVPVPPPSVFEEIVRAKIQERRDWEQRMRWTGQAKTILTGLSSATAAMLAASWPGDGITTENKEKAGNIQTDATKLGEDYNQLTTNHWAIITNVSDREVADRTLAEAADKARAIKHLFVGEGVSVDHDTLNELHESLNKALGDFKKKVDEMLTRLSPPAAQAGS